MTPTEKREQDTRDATILVLWRSKRMDTVAIAEAIGISEAEVYNRLLHAREAAR
ncbi:hypothetical protein [Bradyrhizobium denitrificans]|uniref:hypothetical protein n=1 Tax=Bradyrhizobium denitrificans TaxID=2734912 RepID=UPI0015580682|nr:hypothetical protein [Bradyrhizobium sp. LMG 8443]NPU23982.1 hypothetical protein [Bradyrhizobium sp. LMG 8443]